jgi:hypothetical protein
MVAGGLAQNHPLQNGPQLAVAALQVRLQIGLAVIEKTAFDGSPRSDANAVAGFAKVR